MTRSDLMTTIHFAQREALMAAAEVLSLLGAEQKFVVAVLEIEAEEPA